MHIEIIPKIYIYRYSVQPGKTGVRQVLRREKQIISNLNRTEVLSSFNSTLWEESEWKQFWAFFNQQNWIMLYKRCFEINHVSPSFQT